jgi:hypothetical protein
MSQTERPNGGAYYVEEGRGRMPYLIFYQSKGGWPVFEVLESWADAVRVREAFRARGMSVQIYHWILFQDDVVDEDIESARSSKVTLPPLSAGAITKDTEKK